MQKETITTPFIHTEEKCEHDFRGWRDIKDEQGRIAGGERVCSKCGLGAMAHSMREGI